MNTEIAVLNKINASNLIAIRGSQDTNKLLASVAEQQIIEAKRQRDAEARSHQQPHSFHSRREGGDGGSSCGCLRRDARLAHAVTFETYQEDPQCLQGPWRTFLRS
jgi:hypothetical protein